jgi:hypothetical protein
VAEDGNSGEATYAEFVKDELDAQDARKASFEQRGITVITTSGVLATLLLGLAALSTKESRTFVLPDSSETLLAIALLFFVAAAALALVTNLPAGYEAVKVQAVRDRLNEDPVRNADAAAKDIAETRLKAIATAKKRNKWKGRLLFAALIAEVVAVALVAAGVWCVIT